MTVKTCLLAYVFCTLALMASGNADARFSWLGDLSTRAIRPPVVLTRPGGFLALWSEFDEVPDSEWGRTRHFYYRLADIVGETVSGRQEIPEWVVPSNYFLHTEVNYDRNGCLAIGGDTTLLIAWRTRNDFRQLDRMFMSASGTILQQDTLGINKGVAPLSTLVRASNGEAYLVEILKVAGPAVRIMRVYPIFGGVTVLIEDLYPLLWGLGGDRAVTMTQNDRLLFCFRMRGPSDTSTAWDTPEGWNGMPNDLYCFVTDLKGTVVVEPRRFKLPEVAFRRFPGIHLGGSYGKGAQDDMDLSALPSGEVILSVTGIDEKGDRCVYQVRFSQTGEIQPGRAVASAVPLAYPDGVFLPVTKVALASTVLREGDGYNKAVIRLEYVLYGFDADGNFYEHRETWREGEE